MKKQITTMEMYEKDIEDLEAAVLDGEELLENIDLDPNQTSNDSYTKALNELKRRYGNQTNPEEEKARDLQNNLEISKKMLEDGYTDFESQYQASKSINVPVNGRLVSSMSKEEYYQRYFSKRIHNLCGVIYSLIKELEPQKIAKQKVYARR